MRATSVALAAAMAFATPALAQAVVETVPAAPGAPVVIVPETTGTVVIPVVPGRPLPPTEAASDYDSAKGSNAANPSRMAPNLGGTSGGPAR